MNKEHDKSELLRYFDMLRMFVEGGYLEMMPVSGEAFITRAGIHSLANTEQELKQLDEIKSRISPGKRNAQMDILSETIFDKFLIASRGIWSYMCWLNANEEGYKLFMQANELSPESPYTIQTGEQAYENLQRMRDAAEQVSRRIQKKSVAIHVVANEQPHDLYYTLYYQRKRSLIIPWKEDEHLDIINYRR